MGIRGKVAASVLLLSMSLPAAALADDAAPPSSLAYYEMNFANRDQDYYLAAITAFNRDLTKDGFLFRAEGSYNAYDYRSSADERIRAEAGQGSALVGYQIIRYDVTMSAYVGFDYHAAHLSPTDFENPVRGSEAGVKVIGEIETESEKPFYFDIYGEYSSAFDTYFTRIRYGQKISGFGTDKQISIGPEATLLGDKSVDAQRAGAFVTIPIKLPSFGDIDATAAFGYQWVSGRDSDYATGGAAGGEGAYGTLSFTYLF